MARIISWVIDNKYVYIKPDSPWIYDSSWSNEQVKQHGSNVLTWSEDTYRTNFNRMYEAVTQRWGTAIDLRSDYSYYFNATGNEGVYMLTGIDGANIADYGKPFYNLVIENANTSLGLGGDYTLDVDANVKTWIYLERNGTVYLPDEVSVKYGSETVVSRTYNEPGRTRVEIDIPRGTMFTNNERNREYEITAKKNGFEGRVLFTVVGVKDGEEGMSYDLLVHPKLIKVSSNGEPDFPSVTCKVLKNGEIVPNEDDKFTVRYTFGIPTTDYDDVGNVYDGNPISYSMLSEHDDQVNFYLYVNGRIVDTDSCIVSRDGIDGGFMKLELDNEIDAVGLGSDSKLDVSGGVKFKTGMILYSAGTELTITRVLVDDDGNGNKALPCTDSTGKAHYDVSERNTKYATFHTTLDDGYEFGLDLRNSVKITAYGTNDRGEEGHASANYILLGIQGAEDGVTYKLMPTADYILYDPNTRLVKWGTSDAISVDDIAGHSLGFYPLESGRQKSGGEIVNDHEFLSYSVGIAYTNAGSAVAPILSGQQPQNGMTFNLSELFNEEITSENATSKFVTFYWCKEAGGNFVMLDRETVPVIIQGINGNSIWVELGNEIDAVGVGNDTDLDIEEDVTIGTTVRIISGGTPIRIESIEVIKPRGTESNWDDYAESTTGYTGSDHAMPDNGTHTIGYVSITLKNGFEFGPDYREAPTIKATAVAEDGGWSGFTQYVIKGIANGKDGYVYRLMPEVDYVTFNPNAGHDGTLDENEVSCTAYYGKYELGESGFTNGTIYYSVNCIYDSIPENIPDTSMSGEYVTGFTEYTSSVSLDEILSKENYWNFKYIAFYLVVDTDMPDGTVFRELVDRETVKIISDGLDAQGNATIELTNEIDSIGLGGDTILDLPAGETRRMSTGVRVFSGGTRLSIYELTGAFQAGSNAPSGTYSFGRISPATEDDDDVFYVDLINGFNFGKDYKEKVVVTAKARNVNNETATVSAIFVLAGIKGGKDGQTYKVQPTPDYAFYDLQLGRFIGDNNISARAYSNGKLLSASSTYNVDYQIKYTNNVFYDLDAAEQNWGSTVFKNYPEGSNLNFYTPSGSSDREQAKVFYLAVSSDRGAHWTVVDREGVPLFINGKEGKDGVGAIRFDMTNPFEVINTGEDLTLDSSSWKPYSTVVYGYEGTGKVKITCTSKPSDTSTMKVSAVTASDGFGVTVTVYLRNYTFDSTTQKLSVPLSFWFDDDHAKSGSLTYTLVAIMNGKGAEGDAYRLRTNVSRITTNATSFSPETLLAGVYLGNTLVPATIYAKYKPEGEYLSTLEQMDMRSYDTSSSYTVNALSTTITKAAGDGAKNKNGTLYIAAFDGTSVNAQFLDADDIPIQVDYDEGSASGILADLSDDVGVVGVGDNEKLEADVVGKLTTIGYIFKGRPPMKLSSVDLPNNGNVITDYGGKIQFVLRNFTAGVSTSAEIGINITATTEDYVDFRNNNPLQFNIVLHGAVEDGEEAVERTVGYSLLGLKDGKDGETVHLELNANKIYHNQDTGFSPSDIRCRLYYCGEDITSESAGGENATLRFLVKNSDWEDEQGSEIFWIDEDGHYDPVKECYIFSISDQEYSEYEPLCIRAERKTGNSGTDADWTLLDWETVQVLRDGKDGIGGIELKFDNSPAYVTQVDGSKVVTEDVTATTYATLYSGSTTVKLNSLTLLPDESEYDSSKIHFNSDCPANGSAYVEVGIDAGFSFASLSPIMLRIEGTGTDPDTNEPVVRRATFSIYDAAGGKGERGPKTRIREYSSAVTIDYQNGSDDDAFWDIVYYVTDDGDFGGYFGCKQDQAANSAKVAPSVNDDVKNGLVNENDQYWVYYPDYDFVATKVITVGDWPEGWVIDKGKIQHMGSGVTLTAEGTVEVADADRTYYELEAVGSTTPSKAYTKTNYSLSSNVTKDLDKKITLYQESGDTMVFLRDDLALTASTSSTGFTTTTIPIENISLRISPLDVKTANVVVSKPLSKSFDFRINVYYCPIIIQQSSTSGNFRALISGCPSSVAYSTISPSSVSSSLVFNVGSPSRNSQTDEYPTSSATFNAAISIAKDWMAGNTSYEEYTPSLSSTRLESSGLRLGVQAAAAIDTVEGEIDEGNERLLPNPFVDEIDDGGSGGGGSSSTTEIWNKYADSVYIRFLNIPSGYELSGYDGEENLYFDRITTYAEEFVNYPSFSLTSGNGNDGVLSQSSSTDIKYKTTSRYKKDSSVKKTAVMNGTNEGEVSDYGKLCFAAGVQNCSLYVWYGGSATYRLYTKYPYTIDNTYDTTIGGKAYAYYNVFNTSGNFIEGTVPELVEGTLINSNGTCKISFNGKDYTLQTSIQPIYVGDNLAFSATKIYANGKIVTDDIYVTNGTFNGVVNATDGKFSGEINASQGTLSHVDIVDGTFTGDIDLSGGNTFSIYGENSTVPNVILSSRELTIQQSSYQISFSGWHLNDVNSNFWGRKRVPDNENWNILSAHTLLSQTIIKGSTVTIPSFSISMSFVRKIVYAHFELHYQLGNSTSVRIGQITAQDTNDTVNATTTATSIDIGNTDQVFKLIVKFHYELLTGNFGNSSISFYLNTNNKYITVNTGSESSVRQFKVGPNGFSYVDENGSEMSAISTDANGTALQMMVGSKTQSSTVYTGIQITPGNLVVYVGGNKFKAEVTGSSGSSTRTLNWVYVS